MDINNEERKATAVPSSGQNGDCQIITNGGGANSKMTERRTFEEMCRKRKKHRRGKPKKKQWLRRKEQSDKDGESPQIAIKRRRANAFLHGQPAPNNTTQFIMEDHTDLQLQDFNVHRAKNSICSSAVAEKTGRARDSSFSVDSDEEFYSSPEDEEEFLTKEFSNTYEDVHVERLGTMTKAELIEEYLQLEKRVDSLEKKLKLASRTLEQGGSVTGNDSDGEIGSGELRMDPDTAEKIRIFQEEINKLMVANEELVKENNRLRASSAAGPPSPFSSVDSESDSSSSTGSSHSSTTSSGSCKSKTSQKSDGCKSRSSPGSCAEEAKVETEQVTEAKLEASADNQNDVHVEQNNEPIVEGDIKSEEGGKENCNGEV